MNARDPIPVAVLGGGMAGIAAACALARAGARPVLIESRPYLGGRVRSFAHPATGDEIDNGQHLMMGCYHATFRLLDMLGTRGLVPLQPSLRVEFRDADGGTDLLSAPTLLPSPLDVLAGMLRLRRIPLMERLALLRLGVALRLGTPNADETVADYLLRHGQSAVLRRRLWDPIVIATLNLPPERASATLFVHVMRRAFLGRGTDSHLALPRAGLSRLIEPARDVIERAGGSVLCGTPVTAVTRTSTGYAVHVKDAQPIETATLVSALPERSLRPLLGSTSLGESVLGGLPPLEYSPIVSLYLWYDRALERLPSLAALIGTDVQWMFNRRAMSGGNGRYPGLLSCTISAAFEQATGNPADIAGVADRELRGAFPEMRSAQLMDSLVIKEKHATFAATPGAERSRPEARTDAPGFYLAGDWTRTHLPATIEGAVQSGFAAAEALLATRRGATM